MLPPKIEPCDHSTFLVRKPATGGTTSNAAPLDGHGEVDPSSELNDAYDRELIESSQRPRPSDGSEHLRSLETSADAGAFLRFDQHSPQFHRAGRITIVSPTSAARLVRSRMSPHQEEFWVLALSSTKRVVGFEMLFRGTVDSCLVHPRDIFRFLCGSNATSCIVAHNHPSGDLEASEQDWSFTRRLVRCGRLLEIPLLDHLIVTLKAHTSLASRNPSLFGSAPLDRFDL